MDNESTRDVAMQAKILIDRHMTDCNLFRQNLRSDLAEFRDDLKKINWRIALILGGLVIVAHIVDWVLPFIAHK